MAKFIFLFIGELLYEKKMQNLSMLYLVKRLLNVMFHIYTKY